MIYEDFFNSIISEQDYICGNSFIYTSSPPSIQFCKTDFISTFVNKEVKYFITHNSDYEINQQLLNLGPKFQKWFCQNKNINDNRFISIPIGLENFESCLSYKGEFGKHATLPINGFQKKEYISFLSSNYNTHNNLVYLNFNTTTYPSERNHVKNVFSNEPWVFKQDNVHWKTYYDSLSNSKFCFSPRGNGIDCHRTWEALYLRTIPIIKKEFYIQEFSDLPILFIDDWSQITESYLLEKYEEFKNINFNLDKLKLSYWYNEINN